MANVEVNLVERDPNVLNNHVQVMFEDVLAEPEGVHSADCVWINAYKTFTSARNLCYRLLTYICGIPLALYWGCVFACMSFSQIWCVTPYIRCLHVSLHSYKRAFAIILGATVGPFIETLALFFSRIHVTNSTGNAPKSIGDLPGSPPATKVRSFKS